MPQQPAGVRDSIESLEELRRKRHRSDLGKGKMLRLLVKRFLRRLPEDPEALPEDHIAPEAADVAMSADPEDIVYGPELPPGIESILGRLAILGLSLHLVESLYAALPQDEQPPCVIAELSHELLPFPRFAP